MGSLSVSWCMLHGKQPTELSVFWNKSWMPLFNKLGWPNLWGLNFEVEYKEGVANAAADALSRKAGADAGKASFSLVQIRHSTMISCNGCIIPLLKGIQDGTVSLQVSNPCCFGNVWINQLQTTHNWMLKFHLLITQYFMTQQTNKHSSERTFRIADYIFLKLQP